METLGFSQIDLICSKGQWTTCSRKECLASKKSVIEFVLDIRKHFTLRFLRLTNMRKCQSIDLNFCMIVELNFDHLNQMRKSLHFYLLKAIRFRLNFLDYTKSLKGLGLSIYLNCRINSRGRRETERIYKSPEVVFV